MTIENHQNILPKYRSRFLRSFIPSTFVKGTKIIGFEYFNNYDLPCPIRVDLRFPDGKSQGMVLRISRKGDPIFEAKILKALNKLGLPVPSIIAEDAEMQATILELLDGVNLQELSLISPKKLQTAKELLIQGIKILSGITQDIKDLPLSIDIPHKTLLDEFITTQKSDKPWTSVAIFQESSEIVRSLLEKIDTPLVFTNGDYQPANFLSSDGKNITGLIDFESACFQDPLIGLAKFPIYDLHPFEKAGFVTDFLKANHFDYKEFIPRLALGCLITLQREIPVMGGDRDMENYRNRVLALLSDSIKAGN